MASQTIHIVNAFVADRSGGNPAGVVLNADALTPSQKQNIAAQAGYSETAFVSRSQIADFKLEFFTPNRQIAHCGHATVAAFSFLAQKGMIPHLPQTSKETIDGIRKIMIEGERAFMEQTAPRYTELTTDQLEAVMDSLGLTSQALIEGLRPIITDTGNRLLVVPIANADILANIRPNHELITEVSGDLELVGYYPFALDTEQAGRDATARMFAPLFGIPEESATGMGAGTLGCYLYDYAGFKQEEFVIEQGYLMKPASPSELIVRLDLQDGHIQRLLAGGRAHVRPSMIRASYA